MEDMNCEACGKPMRWKFLETPECGNIHCHRYVSRVGFDRAPETSRRIAAVELCLKLGYVWHEGQWVKRTIDATVFKCGRCSSSMSVNDRGMYVCSNASCPRN